MQSKHETSELEFKDAESENEFKDEESEEDTDAKENRDNEVNKRPKRNIKPIDRYQSEDFRIKKKERTANFLVDEENDMIIINKNNEPQNIKEALSSIFKEK